MTITSNPAIINITSNPIAGYKLVFEDNFNSVTINSLWAKYTIIPWFRGCAKPENLSIGTIDGVSVLKMKVSDDDCYKNGEKVGDFTGCGLDNVHDIHLYSQGIWEVRLKLIDAHTTGVGFYLGLFADSGVPGWQEIDFAETMCSKPTNTVSFTQHWGDIPGVPHQLKSKSIILNDLTTKFHTYRVIVTDQIKWYVDDMVIPKETQPNHWTTSTNFKWKIAAGFVPSCTVLTGLPVYTYIDYVRIYIKN